MAVKGKMLIIALDGARFELIDPWIEEGTLPNIARINGDPKKH